VVEDLCQNGHEVVAVDLVEGPLASATFKRADIENIDSLLAAFDACEAIVHLAAIREAGIAPPEVTFRVNAQGTMNAVEAAYRCGAQRFVLASSEAVLGFAYRERDFHPDYFPIDENHPLRPQDCYGVSKVAAEEICQSYSRRGVLSTVCIRPCYCWGVSLGDEARESLENPGDHFRSLWVYIHLRDIARAYRLACEAQNIEHEAFYVVANDNRSNVPTAELIAAYYPDVPVVRPMGRYDALIANDRARDVLGFVPQMSWRDEIAPQSIPNTV
jgi:UDP-glucose 4-epimerase